MQINYKKEIIIDNRSNSTISDQIVSQFQKILAKSRISHGERLINHKDLAKILKVDPKEVLEAYEILEKYNFIVISNDNVFFTKKTRVLEMFTEYSLIVDNIRSMGKEPSFETLAYEIITMDENQHKFIDLDAYKDKRFLKQVRMFKADNEPYLYLIEYYPVDRFPELATDDNRYIGRIFEDYLRKEYDLHVSKNQRYINVINYDLELANVFGVKKGLPGFEVGLVFYDDNMEVINYGVAYSLPYFSFESNIKL